MGTRWIPAAAHAGPGSVTLWLLAAVFFVVPLAVAVARSRVKYPGAGGFYLWTRDDFGRLARLPLLLDLLDGDRLLVSQRRHVLYERGHLRARHPRTLTSATDRVLLLAVSLAAIWIALGTNLVGMKVGKWTENLGAHRTWLVGVLLVMVRCWSGTRHGAATPIDYPPHLELGHRELLGQHRVCHERHEAAGLMGARDSRSRTHPAARRLDRLGLRHSSSMPGATIAFLVILRPEKISEMNGFAEAGESRGARRWARPGCRP